jgi:hypothetical protein
MTNVLHVHRDEGREVFLITTRFRGFPVQGNTNIDNCEAVSVSVGTHLYFRRSSTIDHSAPEDEILSMANTPRA